MRLSILAPVLALVSGALLVSALPANTSISTTSPSSAQVINLEVDLEKRTGYRKGSWQNNKGQWGKWGESSENKHCTSNAKQTCYNKGKSCSSKCVCVPIKPPTSTKKKSKRDASYRDSLCSAGQTACRVDSGGLTGLEGRFECLDLRSNIESCGGCVAEGLGQDCSAIPGVNEVSCRDSRCVIDSCLPSWNLILDGTACDPNDLDLSDDDAQSTMEVE